MAMIQRFLRGSIDLQGSVAVPISWLTSSLFLFSGWLFRDKPHTTDALKENIRNETSQTDSMTLGRGIDNMQHRIQIYLAEDGSHFQYTVLSMAMIQRFLRVSIDLQGSVAVPISWLTSSLFLFSGWLFRDKPHTTDALKENIRNETSQTDSMTLGSGVDDMQHRIQIYLADDGSHFQDMVWCQYFQHETSYVSLSILSHFAYPFVTCI